MLPKYLAEDAPYVKQKFVLFIVVDIIEYVTTLDGEKFNDCFQVLLTYLVHENPHLRQASSYGVGVAAEKQAALVNERIEETV